MPTPTPTPPAASPALNAIPWGRLLRAIHEHQVIPIIGPGLVTVEHEGRHIPFIEWLAPEMCRRLQVPFTPGMTLNRAACAYLVNKGKRKDIYEELRELLDQYADLPTPPGLANLAAIRDFDLFVSSTFDGFLAKALAEKRLGWQGDKQGRAAFHPNKIVDLPKPLPGTFLYHILGADDTYPDFAVWEEDYMEFLCGLLEAPKDNLQNLFAELRSRSLLIIGAPFDDWIVRFFLRVAKRGRLSELPNTDVNYLADHFEDEHPMVFYFDKVICAPQILHAEPQAFVAELCRRWVDKYEASTTASLLASIPDDMEHGSVFISYSKDDFALVAPFAAALKAAGIPVWLDAKRLNAGTDWEAALQRAVKSRASLFLSLISAATEGDPERVVHRERAWAAERQSPGCIFYIPVIIDDTTNPKLEPQDLQKHQRHRLPGAMLAPDFALLLRRYLDQHRKCGEVRDV